MSLDFSVRDIADHESVTTHPQPCPETGGLRWHPVTEVLVFFSVPCGTPEITLGNFEEVWRRVKIWQEALPSAPIVPDVYLTRDDVVAHVGLSTNASRKTSTEFHKTLAENLFRRTMVQEQSALEKIGVYKK